MIPPGFGDSMSYYPFIRGKQFELLMLREMAPSIAQWGFVPIIEPVKREFTGLETVA